jgi:hypothetical protein
VAKQPKLRVIQQDGKEVEMISAITLEGVRQQPAIGTPPQRVERVPTSIAIDRDFQRNISRKGDKLIQDMIQQWSWPAFIPPAIYLDERTGVETAYDGQHTLIGAASRNDIQTLPMDLHASLEDAVAAAAAFLDRNTKRIGVAPLQRYKAAIIAGKDWALTLKAMSEKVGFHIPYYPSASPKPDTVLSISTMQNIMEDHGADGLAKIMKILVGNAISPIREMHLVAIEMLLYAEEYRKLVRADRLNSVLRGINNHLAIGEAQTEAIKRGMTRAQCLANVYLREYQGVHGVR